MPERALLVEELHTLEVRISAPLNTNIALLVGLLGRWLGDNGYNALIEHTSSTERFSLVVQDDDDAVGRHIRQEDTAHGQRKTAVET